MKNTTQSIKISTLEKILLTTVSIISIYLYYPNIENYITNIIDKNKCDKISKTESNIFKADELSYLGHTQMIPYKINSRYNTTCVEIKDIDTPYKK